MSDITLSQYAEQHDRNPATARQRAIRGAFHTARKVGRQWMIDENEPWNDGRSNDSETVYWYGIEAYPPIDNNMVADDGHPMGYLQAFTTPEKAKAWNDADEYIGGSYNRYLLDRDKALKLMRDRLLAEAANAAPFGQTAAEIHNMDDVELYDAYGNLAHHKEIDS